MTTDDLTGAIRKFTSANGHGPSFEELRDILVYELNSAVSEDDLTEELGNAILGGFIMKDDNGNFVVL